MMYISAREKLIVEILLEQRDKLTIKMLAEEVEVSPRTIHRDLKGIESLLKTYHLELVRKTGMGIQVIGSLQDKESLKRKLMTVALQDYMADERQTLILSTLYEAAGPVKLFTLAHELRVTESTISADLLKLEEQIAHFELSILKKRGYGIELSGTEEAKRRAISYVIAKTLKEDEFLSLIRQNKVRQSNAHEESISERLLHLIDRDKLMMIEEVIRKLKHETLQSMTDQAYVGLIVHVALAVERIKQGEKIEMGAELLSQLQSAPEYLIAERIIKELAIHFQITIPDAEVGYITMHLQGAKLRQTEENLLKGSSLQIMMQAQQLVKYVEKETGHELLNNRSFLEGLVTHLKPALYRIQQNMGITNPLLQNVRKDYEALFQIVREACAEVFQEFKIPEQEIGFLVMHFGAAILSVKGKHDLKAYVVCSSGIGTSKMLATQLRREVPEIEEIRNVSAFELSELTILDRDLVISTIHLPTFSKEYMIVSPFLTGQEIQDVQLQAKRKLLMKKVSSAFPKKQEDIIEIKERVKKIHDYTGAVFELLNGFQQTIAKEVKTLPTYVEMVCQQLGEKAILQNAKVVADALIERQELSGVGIPGTQMALLHTKHSSIQKASFTIHVLREPIKMRAMDDTVNEVNHLLFLLAPDPYHEAGLEVLSLISTLLIESEQSIELFQSNDEARIHTYLGINLEQFINEKLKN